MALTGHVCRGVTPDDSGFQELAREAGSEGYHFVDRLRREWTSRSNRFEHSGECLLGIVCDAKLLAIGGLNRDPFTGDDATGRIRHLFVRAECRRVGLGTLLLHELVAHSRNTFKRLRLRTDSPAACKFYEKLGFQPIQEPGATHVWPPINASQSKQARFEGA